jgi:hypothetical protein
LLPPNAIPDGNTGELLIVTPSSSPLKPKHRKRAMLMLIGAATAASTLMSMALGQINSGFEALGVLLAAVVLMTLRQE